MSKLGFPGGGLDQAPPAADHILDEINEVDNLFKSGDLDKSPDEAFEYGHNLAFGVQSKAIAFTYLVYRLSQKWTKYGLDDTFEDRLFFEWGLSKNRTKQYVGMWRMVLDNQDIPEDAKRLIMEKNLTTIYKMMRPAREKSLTEDDWREIAKAPDHSSTVRLINDKIGKSNRGPIPLNILLYDDGRLVAFEGDDQAVLAIVRNSDEDLKNDLRYRALDRLRRGAGIQDV